MIKFTCKQLHQKKIKINYLGHFCNKTVGDPGFSRRVEGVATPKERVHGSTVFGYSSLKTTGHDSIK